MPLEPMMDAARKFPQHIRQGVQAVEQADTPDKPYANAIACGMGGSSIGGTLAVRLLDQRADVPLQVVRDHKPPAFVDEDTLVVATSYSGNTDETVDAVRASLEKGATLVALTTNGDLEQIAEEAGAPVVSAPSGYHPRAAIGWLMAANYATFSACLGLDNATETLRQGAKRLEARVDELADEGGPADQIAEKLGPHPVGVVGHDVLGTVARRWAGELGENAKRLAFHGVLPEMAHNQIVGWANQNGGTTLLQVRREEEGPREATRMNVLAERARGAGANVLETQLGGQGITTVLEGVLVGDLVSLHRARRDGTDPEPVAVIDDLKDQLAKADDLGNV